MKSTWKYPLSITDRQIVSMPQGAQILTVQVQHDTPCLWALVNSENPLQARGIQIFGTGHPASNAGEYIGTFQVAGGSLVFHVFEDRDAEEN